MKRYPQYKDSGISWIGQVPAHWKQTKLRNLLRFVSRRNMGKEQLLSVTREQGVIVRNTESKEENHNFIPEDLSNYKYVEPGWFVINKMKSWQGSYGVSNLRGIVSPAYYVCKLSCDNKAFFSAAIRSKAYIPFFTQFSKGIRVDQWDLSPIGLKNIPFFMPSPDEQQAIVDFLDHATTKIDEYISMKEAEIDKLGQLEQSIISEVVTRGLDPNVPMKDSDIPWLGQIPAHWERIRSKNLFEKMNRPVEKDDEVITCFRDGQVTLRRNRRTEGFTESFKEIGYQGICPGDLVIHQMDAFAGAIGVSDSKGKGTPVYICLQSKQIVFNNYYAYLLREMARKGYIKALYRGIRERSSDFRFETFSRLYLPVPPLEEQKAIVAFLDRKIQEVDGFIANIRTQIEKLKIYRQRLISDAVTGKIDVRNPNLSAGSDEQRRTLSLPTNSKQH